MVLLLLLLFEPYAQSVFNRFIRFLSQSHHQIPFHVPTLELTRQGIHTTEMPTFSRLIRFQGADSHDIYFADLGLDTIEPPHVGSKIEAYRSFDELTSGENAANVPLGKVDYFDPQFPFFADQKIAALSTPFSWGANLLRWHELQNSCGRSESKP